VLDRPLETGLHRLRVDAVDAQGTVIARVETPFSRASLAEVLPDETSVIVQPGNSLWRIARRVYGEGIRYAVIFEANQEQIRDPDLIYPGQIFKMPMTTPAAAPSN
jgi:nucleoid-associated protein YgaU